MGKPAWGGRVKVAEWLLHAVSYMLWKVIYTGENPSGCFCLTVHAFSYLRYPTIDRRPSLQTRASDVTRRSTSTNNSARTASTPHYHKYQQLLNSEKSPNTRTQPQPQLLPPLQTQHTTNNGSYVD